MNANRNIIDSIYSCIIPNKYDAICYIVTNENNIDYYNSYITICRLQKEKYHNIGKEI